MRYIAQPYLHTMYSLQSLSNARLFSYKYCLGRLSLFLASSAVILNLLSFASSIMCSQALFTCNQIIIRRKIDWLNTTISHHQNQIQKELYCQVCLHTHKEVCTVMITYNIYIVIRETGQFSSKGIINDFIGNLNRLTVSRRFTEQAV